jgi:hypothetical protein
MDLNREAQRGFDMIERAFAENRQFVFIAEFDDEFIYVTGTAKPEWIQKVLPAILKDMESRGAHEFSKQ